jgi:hypothetical protein
MDYSVWDEFQWIPADLIANWIVAVKSTNVQDSAMQAVLWDKDTMVFFGCYKGTMKMLRGATKSWRPSKRLEYGTYLLSLVLAIESLGCDFAEWGTQHRDAKAKAEEILDTYFISNRTRLLDVYMPLRAELDEERVKVAFGPK